MDLPSKGVQVPARHSSLETLVVETWVVVELEVLMAQSYQSPKPQTGEVVSAVFEEPLPVEEIVQLVKQGCCC